MSVFSVIPSEGIVNGNSSLKVKIIFSPDRPNENFYEVLTLDVPNQINEKKILIRGYSYPRQAFARAEEPFKWREQEYYKNLKLEEPLLMKELDYVPVRDG